MHAFIISDVPPDKAYTGGQVLYKMIENMSNIQFSILWLNQSNLPSNEKLPKNSRIIANFDFHPNNLTKILQRTIDKIGAFKVLRPFSILIRGFVYYARLIRYVLKISVLIRLQKPNFIWMVLQGDKLATIYWLVCILNKSQLLILHQWDPISWWLNSRNRPNWYIRYSNGLVKMLETRVNLNIVPSLAWSDKLTSEKKEAICIDNFLQDNQFWEPYLNYSLPGKCNVVFIGQLYANDELELICSALKQFQDKNNIEMLLHYYGDYLLTETFGLKVIFHGFIDPEDLTNEIKIYDLALLPYPSEVKLEETARLSFPSKCRQYLFAGLPILAYAPPYSGVHQFLEHNFNSKYYFNIAINTNLDKFLDNLIKLNPEDKKELHMSGIKISLKYFSLMAEMIPFKNYIEKIRYL